MSKNDTRKFERYSIYKNEPIDKLVVNRPLQRIYEDIDKLSSTNNLHIESATETKYGTVQYSNNSEYIFDPDLVTSGTSGDYYNNIMRSDAADDFATSISDKTSSASETASVDPGTSISDATYYMRMKSHDVEFVSMPNGVSCIIGSLEIGLNNILTTFSEDNVPLTGDISLGKSLTGYSSYIVLEDSDLDAIDDYANEQASTDAHNWQKVEKLKELNGRKIPIEYPNEYSATLRNNICHWTTYSSYNQSFVEIHLLSKIDTKRLYEAKESTLSGHEYGVDSFYNSKYNELTSEAYKGNTSTKHPRIIFSQKPFVMMQVGFYTNDGVLKPVFGKDERIDTTKDKPEVEFLEYNTVGMQKLTDNDDNESISPVVGFVTVNDIDHEYDEEGAITNTIVHFDVAMKFLVGSAADPKMIYGMRSLNTRAKVQFTIMGI